MRGCMGYQIGMSIIDYNDETDQMDKGVIVSIIECKNCYLLKIRFSDGVFGVRKVKKDIR